MLPRIYSFYNINKEGKYRDENTKNIQHFVGPETKDD